MPEHSSEFRNQEVEAEKNQREFDERMVRVRMNMEELFDRAQTTRSNPSDMLLSEGLDDARSIYGGEAVSAFIADVKNFDISSRNAFVEQATARVGEILRAAFFDPEVRARVEAMRAENHRNTEYVSFNHLKAKICDFPWEGVRLSDAATLSPGEKVMEISWPGDEQDAQPTGIHDIQKSFQEMAEYISDHPEIKAVVAVSWMMSRGVAGRLGFQVHPEIPIDIEQQRSVVDWASKARQQKPYVKGVSTKDVQLGVIPRETFLQRYGT